MPANFPKRLIVGDGASGRIYRVAGTADRTPKWQVAPVPSQDGDPMQERRVSLGDGSVGLIGSRRSGARPAIDGVADVVNGDTSVEDRYGAGPLVTEIALTEGNTPHSAGTIGGSLTIGGVATGAQDFMLSLGPSAGWGLGEASGDALDLVGSLDGTVTIGAGTRDSVALDDAGDGSATFDGAASSIQISDAAAIQNIWDGGGVFSFLIQPGDSTTGVIAQKGASTGGWRIDSGSGLIAFVQFFSTDFGSWVTSASVINTDEVNLVAVSYDSSSDANTPTIYVWNPTDGFSTLTVGDGLSESQGPSGSYTSDVGEDLYLGSRSESSPFYAGILDEVFLFNGSPPNQQAIEDYVDRVRGAAFGGGSIGGGTVSNTPTAIWGDTGDDFGNRTRYINLIAGGRMKVIDPTDDSVVETTEWPNVDGGDSARWVGQQWLARRGGPSDFAQYVSGPFDGTQTTFTDADFTATGIHSGPDALYRAHSNFAGNVALIKKSTATTPATVAADANWAPSAGETMADPGIPITRLATLGEDLVVGKRDGLFEFDSTFTPRVAIEWMKAFLWEHNCNAILPLGQNREVIVSFRRGLYYLPLNKSIGVEQLSGNETDIKGRYTAIEYDGNWIYAFLENTDAERTYIVKMRPRRSPGPGLFEHHPIARLIDRQVLAAYLWPGATIDGTVYGPRLYFGNGADSVAYIRLGDTQPDVLDPNYHFTDGNWSIRWPQDDFGNPSTLKVPYKIEANYKGVTGTTGMFWSVRVDGGIGASMTENGGDPASNTVLVSTDGFHQRFGRRDNSQQGRTLTFILTGFGGSLPTVQQRIEGAPVVTLLEQPEMVDLIETTLELERNPTNDEDAEQQWRTLSAQVGQIVPIIAEWGDELPDTTFYGRVAGVSRVATVTAAGAPGIILAQVQLRALDFSA